MSPHLGKVHFAIYSYIFIFFSSQAAVAIIPPLLFLSISSSETFNWNRTCHSHCVRCSSGSAVRSCGAQPAVFRADIHCFRSFEEVFEKTYYLYGPWHLSCEKPMQFIIQHEDWNTVLPMNTTWMVTIHCNKGGGTYCRQLGYSIIQIATNMYYHSDLFGCPCGAG